jgi:hypothetical protein
MGVPSERGTIRHRYLAGGTQLDGAVPGACADEGVAAGDVVGATQPDGAAAGGCAAAGVTEGDVVGATQLPGAEAMGAGADEAVGALAGVDCNLASIPGDGVPSMGRPCACSKPAIAAWVLGPMKPSAEACRYPRRINSTWLERTSGSGVAAAGIGIAVATGA